MNLDQIGLAFQRKSLAQKKFVLSGHTDSIGENDYNLELSKHRAIAAKNYLVSKYHIEASRILSIGYGETHPIEVGNDNLSLAANRRVEIEEWNQGKTQTTNKAQFVEKK